MRHLVIGGNSKIGAALVKMLQTSGEDVRSTSRRAVKNEPNYLDLEHPELFEMPEVDVVYMVAALSRLKPCRENPDASRRINVDAVRCLAGAAAGAGAFFLFLSRDKVFDGSIAHPGVGAPVSPACVYGSHKDEAEKTVLELGAQGAVLRLSKVMEPSDPLFGGWLEGLREGRSINAFADMYLAPVAIDRVASTMGSIAANRGGGIWHLTGRDDVSYVEVGEILAKKIGADTDLIHSASAAAFGIPPEERPRHTALDLERVEKELGIKVGTPEEELIQGLRIQGEV